VLLREEVSDTLRNAGEGGKGSDVGEGGQEDSSNIGLDTDFEGGEKRYAAISGGISRSGATGRVMGPDGSTRGASKGDCGKYEIATSASDDSMGSGAGSAWISRTEW
jgi:hypothetical protein